MAANPRIALYPGTFDPITNGHFDIITRATRLADKLVVGVAINEDKRPLFTLEERITMVEAEMAPLRAKGALIEVRPFQSLLMHFAQEVGASQIVRGLRAVSDFDYEFQMAGMNARLNTEIETVFLMASEGCHFIASKLVKEVGRLGGKVDSFVSPRVAAALRQRLGKG